MEHIGETSMLVSQAEDAPVKKKGMLRRLSGLLAGNKPVRDLSQHTLDRSALEGAEELDEGVEELEPFLRTRRSTHDIAVGEVSEEDHDGTSLLGGPSKSRSRRSMFGRARRKASVRRAASKGKTKAPVECTRTRSVPTSFGSMHEPKVGIRGLETLFEEGEELADVAIRSATQELVDAPIFDDQVLSEPLIVGSRSRETSRLAAFGIPLEPQAQANAAFMGDYLSEMLGEDLDLEAIMSEHHARDPRFFVDEFEQEEHEASVDCGRSGDKERLLLPGTFEIPKVEADLPDEGNYSWESLQAAFSNPAEVLDDLMVTFDDEEYMQASLLPDGGSSVEEMNEVYLRALDRGMDGGLVRRLSHFEMGVFLKVLAKDPKGIEKLRGWHARLSEDRSARPAVKREIQDYINKHISMTDIGKIAMQKYIATLDEHTKKEIAVMTGKYLFNFVTCPVQAPVKLGIALSKKESRKGMAKDVKKVFSKEAWKTHEQKKKFAELLVKVGVAGLVGTSIGAAATGVGAPVTAAIVLGSVTAVGVATKVAVDVHAHKSAAHTLGELLNIGVESSVSGAMNAGYSLALGELAGVIHEAMGVEGSVGESSAYGLAREESEMVMPSTLKFASLALTGEEVDETIEAGNAFFGIPPV